MTTECIQGVLKVYCANCGKHLAYCDCPDIEERLEALANNPIVGYAIKQNILARRMVKKKEKPERRGLTMANYDSRGRMKYDPKHHFRQGKCYTTMDDATIVYMHYMGKGHLEIGLEIGRTPAAVSQRICHLIQHGLYADYLPSTEANNG